MVGGKNISNILRIDTGGINKQNEEFDDFGLYDTSARRSSEYYFLNYYSPKDLTKLFNDCGIISVLRNKHNFKRLYLKIDINEYDQHSLYVFDETTGDIPLILLRLREVYFDAVKNFITGIKLANIPMLMIDWITLQNPRKKFDENRKKMPGQSHPGLGLLRNFYKLLLKMAKDLEVKSLLAIPEYFHLASIYSPIMRFYDPELQGKFESMLNDLHFSSKKSGKKRTITECSALIDEGKLFNYIKNEVEYWHPSEMMSILEKKDEVYNYFTSPIYEELKNSYKESNRYRFLI